MNFVRLFTMIGLFCVAMYGMNQYAFAAKAFDRKLGLAQYIFFTVMFVVGIAVFYA